jgi:hypothetical protein
LLVEGRDTQVFVERLLAHLGLRNDFNTIAFDAVAGEDEPPQVADFGGVSQLRATLKVVANDPAFGMVRDIAIVRDAEGSAVAAWQSVQSAITAAGLVPPVAAGAYGGGTPRVGVFLLPGGARGGMLETLCWDALREQAVAQCVDPFLAAASDKGADIRNQDKSRMAAWLSTRMGSKYLDLERALQNNHVPLDHEAFAHVRSFLAGL